jgi:hypothetical protein
MQRAQHVTARNELRRDIWVSLFWSVMVCLVVNEDNEINQWVFGKGLYAIDGWSMKGCRRFAMMRVDMVIRGMWIVAWEMSKMTPVILTFRWAINHPYASYFHFFRPSFAHDSLQVERKGVAFRTAGAVSVKKSSLITGTTVWRPWGSFSSFFCRSL